MSCPALKSGKGGTPPQWDVGNDQVDIQWGCKLNDFLDAIGKENNQATKVCFRGFFLGVPNPCIFRKGY